LFVLGYYFAPQHKEASGQTIRVFLPLSCRLQYQSKIFVYEKVATYNRISAKKESFFNTKKDIQNSTPGIARNVIRTLTVPQISNA